MKLFLASLWIATKHSSRRLLCLVCVLAVCIGLLAGSLAAQPVQQTPTARIAVRCLDNHPLIPMAMGALTQSGELSALFAVELLDDPNADTSGYTAVVTLPQGFVESILNGQNHSPVVELNLSSPLEAVFVRQLADGAARALTTAQLAVYTVQEAVDYGKALSPQRYQLLLANINLVFVRAFAQRLELLDVQLLDATGGLTLPRYYLASLVGLLLLAYGFLYLPAVGSLRQFAGCATPGQRRTLWSAAAVHILLLTLLLTAPLAGLAVWERRPPGQTLAAWGLLAVLVCGWSMLLTLLLPQKAACSAGCLLLAAGFGLCSGGLLPLPLMPEAFGPLARLLPSTYTRLLAGVLLGDSLTTAAAVWAGVLAAALLAGAALLWRWRTTKGEV